MHQLTTEKVAVKTFEKQKLADPNAKKRVMREIRIMKLVTHPNIIKLFEVSTATRRSRDNTCTTCNMQAVCGGPQPQRSLSASAVIDR